MFKAKSAAPTSTVFRIAHTLETNIDGEIYVNMKWRDKNLDIAFADLNEAYQSIESANLKHSEDGTILTVEEYRVSNDLLKEREHEKGCSYANKSKSDILSFRCTCQEIRDVARDIDVEEKASKFEHKFNIDEKQKFLASFSKVLKKINTDEESNESKLSDQIFELMNKFGLNTEAKQSDVVKDIENLDINIPAQDKKEVKSRKRRGTTSTKKKLIKTTIKK